MHVEDQMMETQSPSEPLNGLRRTCSYLLQCSHPLPPNVITYPNQIGGHGLVFGNKCRVLYSEELGMVFKPVQRFPKGPHELDFYQQIFDPDCTDPILLELKPYIPCYVGLFHDPSNNTLYLGMKDILSDFKQPSMCDIKMGRRTYGPDSQPSKVMVERAKYKWREEIGFLMTGLRIRDGKSRQQYCFDIFYGRSLDPSTVYHNGIRLFLGQDLTTSIRLARLFIIKLTRLANWFEKQTRFNFYASSLILAYESEPLPTSPIPKQSLVHQSTTHREQSMTNCPTDQVAVYLVDFARWAEVHNRKDENFLYGLRYLIQLFKRAVSETKPSPNPADLVSV